MLPTVWRSLQQSGVVLPGDIPEFPADASSKSGDWPVQVIDLTNNAKPEMVLTISAASDSIFKSDVSWQVRKVRKLSYFHRTLILSDSGKVIYTDFQKSSQRLTAIAKLLGDSSLALLVEIAITIVSSAGQIKISALNSSSLRKSRP